ncbi:hypothetical protein [Phenylobacterium sp.]|uniref:hypothetical protein n=1 Tax=Phenylobacterium sp. TaxID=1871053 RepID=UPI00271B2458|nr:hypothetical protein [Phenylobacterium sp.]MDO8378886.1 hypothetical protein [Phenylobacterium sp.]
MRGLVGLRHAAFVALVALAPLGTARAAPPEPAACAALKSGAEAALSATSTLSTGPVSYPGLADAPGCTITFSGTGQVFGPSFQAVGAKLDAMLKGQGWTQDHNADADGPTGTATGYRKATTAVAVSVGYDTPKGVCREDAPMASCHPTPAQMSYTITLGARPGS